MRILERIKRDRWEIGFVEGGLSAVMGKDPLKIQWLKHPYRDRWFADPFVLDVTDSEISILAEEFRYETRKGRIALLVVDRQNYVLKSMSIALETATHLSFPEIWREDGRVYVCPESWQSGELSLYELKGERCDVGARLVICEESMADAVLTKRFGKLQLFSVKANDKLRIYNFDAETERFVMSYEKPFGKATARNAGDFFEYEGQVYRPAQVCIDRYGEAVEIQKVVWDGNDNFCFVPYKTLYSSHASLKTGMHTLNCFKGVVVIDVRGWKHPRTVRSLMALKKMFECERRK